MFKVSWIWVIAVWLIAAVALGGLVSPTPCIAGSVVPCKDTEHPGAPPCNMKTCKRGNGSQCTHWCSKGKGCCFCDKKQCSTGTPDGDDNEERPNE